MRWIVLLLALVCAIPSVRADERVALVIGNGAYTAAPALRNPVADAGALAEALRRLDFTVVEGTDLDNFGMQSRIRQFARKLDGADIALFFYAGHGVQVAGRNYMLPTDAVLEKEHDLDFAAVDVELVVRQMDRSARTKIVLLDACRDNPFRTELSRSMGATRSAAALSRGLAPIEAEGGALIGFATDPGDVALDGTGEHSPFTLALLKHIETPNLEIHTMMTRVRAEVYEGTNKRQRPWTTSSLIGEVYLNIENAESVEITTTPGPAPSNTIDLELALWQAVAAGGTLADYEAYLEQFPEGTFAGVARNRIAALDGAVLDKPDPLAGAQPAAPAQPADPADDAGAVAAPSAPVPETGVPSAALTGTGTAEGLPSQLPAPDPEPEPELAMVQTPQAKPAIPAGGTTYKDCDICPEMVAIPAGTFRMGSDAGEPAESPVREITLAPFLMSKFEIGLTEYTAMLGRVGAIAEPNSGCYAWTRRGKMRRESALDLWDPDYWSADIVQAWIANDARGLPVACVSWEDARAYVDWLNAQVEGEPYRLPSEAEFEYALRAGATGTYPWGEDAADACTWANAADADSRFKWRNTLCVDAAKDIALSGTFPANAFGLHDMTGNLWEWTADCWNDSHKGARANGIARQKGNCRSRVLRGASWDDPVAHLRSAYRVGIPANRRQINVGFRVVRDPVD